MTLLSYYQAMDLIAMAVPFFLLALLLELIVDRVKGRNYFRANDAINSLSAGTLSTTGGYFTGFIGLFFWGFVLENFSIVDMPLTWFDASPSGMAMWIVAALAWDFCYYWFHRLSHEISIFWAAHAVHHQSEDYNLSTALRQTSTDFLFSWVFYVPLFLIGFPLQVLLTVKAVNLIYQFWVHTQFVRHLGVLDYVLVTPSNHRVHHAQNERYIDKNFGGMLILWDRMFGTFQDERDDEPVVFGVRKPLANWNPFWANLQVYDYLWFDAVHTKRWRDKLGIWFRHTGWRPADVAEDYPKSRVDLSTFDKFDPPVAKSIRRYVLAQFMAAIVVVLLIADLYAKAGAIAVVWPCFTLWAQLYTIGLLNEGRVYAARLEAVRLILVVPVSAGLFVAASVIRVENALLWTAVGGYVVISLFGLLFVSKSRIRAK
jgi:sterol desaturase/sphingolipid hydroxylase (fatty acid hydroxylase superfamily)